MRAKVVLFCFAGVLVSSGCSVLFNWDRLASDPGARDAAADGAASDAGLGPVTYNDIRQAGFWERFDTTRVTVAAAGLGGAVFDGHYVYFPPASQFGQPGRVMRYDTSAPFDASSSWKEMDLTPIDPTANKFVGGAFDGRYVYFGPYPLNDPRVARYDTKADFQTAGAWTIYPIGQHLTQAEWLSGLVLTADYLYLLPSYSSKTAVRHSMNRDFTDDASWELYRPGLAFCHGGATDGKILVLSPETGEAVVRQDIGSDFDAGWQAFSPSVFDSRANGIFCGAVHVPPDAFYLVPASAGVAVRLHAERSFTGRDAWEFSGVPRANGIHYCGGSYDGRFVYFVPYEREDGGASGEVVRYDTQYDFGADSAWSKFEARGDAGPIPFSAAVFDGKYVYFAPRDVSGHEVWRFRAIEGPALPRTTDSWSP